MTIKFGPAGLGPVKKAEQVLEEFAKLGIKVCEIAFTYGVYIKDKKDAERIGKKAQELGIELSIHAPYWINLNSKEKEKVKSSKKRILKCLEIGTILKAKKVVFHAGFYSGMEKEKAYQNIKEQIPELQRTRKEKKYTPELCPETMGKINVFGSAEEIARLVRDAQCEFCIDFAHILAREGELDMAKIVKLFPNKKWHCHFSGIEYGEKGEKRHKITEKEYWKWLLKKLPKDKDITIINESPNPVDDSVAGLKIYLKKIRSN
jgi:deoxyribonuclease IV